MSAFRRIRAGVLLAFSFAASAQPPSDSGALDATFGAGGKEQMRAFPWGIRGATCPRVQTRYARQPE